MKKWIFTILAVLIVGFISYLYIGFNGNFFSKMIAKNIAEKHIEQLFENHTISEGDSYYNFKDGRYTFEFRVHNEANYWLYSVGVRGAFIPQKKRIYTYLQEESVDNALSASYQLKGEEFVNTLLKEENIASASVWYYITVPKNFYQEPKAWEPAIEEAFMPELSVSLKDEQQTPEQFLKAAQVIQKRLNDAQFTYLNVYVSITREYDNSIEQREGYADIFYETVYSIQFTPQSGTLTIDDISQ